MLNINDVAIYLRESRNSSNGKEDVLGNQESILLKFAEDNNFNFVVYKEREKGRFTPDILEIYRLLDDVKQNFYDAVLVIDEEHLNAGATEDFLIIKKILKETNTYLITLIGEPGFNPDEKSLAWDLELYLIGSGYRTYRRKSRRTRRETEFEWKQREELENETQELVNDIELILNGFVNRAYQKYQMSNKRIRRGIARAKRRKEELENQRKN